MKKSVMMRWEAGKMECNLHPYWVNSVTLIVIHILTIVNWSQKSGKKYQLKQTAVVISIPKQCTHLSHNKKVAAEHVNIY